MTTADFAQYKAIIIPDPNCGVVSDVDFLDSNKATWSPAIQGNIILIGTDPDYHNKTRAGAQVLIQDGIRFAATGNGTGLYFALSCYYQNDESATVNSLSWFGTFTVRGTTVFNECDNNAHVVANSSALEMLDDVALSGWGCSVHEMFTDYPTTGFYAFVALVIAEGVTGAGVKDFADGTTGVPYIIVKGATPVGCGDGVYDPTLGEECDAGSLNGTPQSNCSASCKCLYGSISPGVCAGNSATTTTSTPTPTPTPSSSTFNSRYAVQMLIELFPAHIFQLLLGDVHRVVSSYQHEVRDSKIHQSFQESGNQLTTTQFLPKFDNFSSTDQLEVRIV